MGALLLRLIAAALLLTAAASLVRSSDVARQMTGGVSVYTVAKGDTLANLAARVGVDARTLAADNGLEAGAALATGTHLRIDNRHLVPTSVTPGVIVINLPQRMLFYEAEAIAGFPIAVGQPTWRTPTRQFTVLTKETDPTWDVPESILAEARAAGKSLPKAIPPGPTNPLGRHWLGLSISGVGIHGTNAPSSLYRAATHGCIRVAPENIAWLFDRVVVGTRGLILYEPILLGVVGDDVFLEVHRDIYGRLPLDPYAHVQMRAEEEGIAAAIDWARAAAVIAARHGVARPVGLRGSVPGGGPP